MTMCLYPRFILNRKYLPNKKNVGTPPECTDPRAKMVPVGCGKCIECLTQKARAWSVRLQEEIRSNKQGQYVTLTFSNESIAELTKEIDGLDGYELDNEIAKLAVRRFLERWRKKYGVSVKHWLVTELGHQGTENIHLHGLIFTDNKQDIQEIWKYGFTYIGEYVNEQTINYIVKYISKQDKHHLYYNPRILTSPGMGSAYTQRPDATLNQFKGEQTKEAYSTRQGYKLNLPIYYRNKIYSEEQKEKLWLQKLDKNVRWIRGHRIDVSKGEDRYFRILKYNQAENERLGYGNNSIDWNRKNYERHLRNLKRIKRIEDSKINYISENYDYETKDESTFYACQENGQETWTQNDF